MTAPAPGAVLFDGELSVLKVSFGESCDLVTVTAGPFAAAVDGNRMRVACKPGQAWGSGSRLRVRVELVGGGLDEGPARARP